MIFQPWEVKKQVEDTSRDTAPSFSAASYRDILLFLCTPFHHRKKKFSEAWKDAPLHIYAFAGVSTLRVSILTFKVCIFSYGVLSFPIISYGFLTKGLLFFQIHPERYWPPVQGGAAKAPSGEVGISNLDVVTDIWWIYQ